VQRRLQLDELAAGHERVERRLLECDADPAADLRRLRLDVEAGHARAPARRPQERHEHAHGGRLAGAVGAEEAVDLAGRDLEIDPVDGLQAALEFALQPGDLDGSYGRMLLHVQLLLGPHATTTA
jgi:hypothetical protein